MKGQAWTQHQTKKMAKIKILKEHWERTKIDNQNQMLNCLITIEMNKKVIELCDEEIAKFPEVEKKSPAGVR